MGSKRAGILPREQLARTRAWSRAPLDPQLGAGAPHIWRVDLEAVGDGVAESLDDAEHERAERIVGERIRQLWIRSRGTLRTLLGRYLLVEPGVGELTSGG